MTPIDSEQGSTNPLHALHAGGATTTARFAPALLPPIDCSPSVSSIGDFAGFPAFPAHQSTPGSSNSPSRARAGSNISGNDKSHSARTEGDSPVSGSVLVSASVLGSLASAVRRRAGSSKLSPSRSLLDSTGDSPASAGTAKALPVSTVSPLHAAHAIDGPASGTSGGSRGPPSPASEQSRRREAARARAAAAAARLQLQGVGAFTSLGSPGGFFTAPLASEGPSGGLLDLLRAQGILAPGVIESMRQTSNRGEGALLSLPLAAQPAEAASTGALSERREWSPIGHLARGPRVSGVLAADTVGASEPQSPSLLHGTARELPVAAATRERATSLQLALFPGLQVQSPSNTSQHSTSPSSPDSKPAGPALSPLHSAMNGLPTTGLQRTPRSTRASLQ